MGKHKQSADSQILGRIRNHGKGWVFTPADFLDCGSRAAVASTLKRLKASGVVRQLARGLYDYPAHHPKFGVLTPSSDDIAKALTARDAIRLQPAGAYAANVLGLSEQVPSMIVFLTDGTTRHVKLGKREIILQHTTPRYMATAGRKSGTIIQALRYLGRDRVNDKVLAILQRQITGADRRQLCKDLRHAPAWIAEILRQLAQNRT